MAAPFRCMAFCTLSLLFGDQVTPSVAVRQGQTSERPALEWLKDLGDAGAVERQAAHAWLVRNLGPDHWVALVEAAGSPSYAARRGLARVLADHPRHFSLAARLTALQDPVLAEVGDWALQESALAWNPNLAETSLGVEDFPTAWLAEGGRKDLLEVNPSRPKPGGLSVALGFLNQYGAAPVALVLDPRSDPRRRLVPPVGDQGKPLHGSWDMLLISLVRKHKVTLEVVGWRPKSVDLKEVESIASPGAFIRIKNRGETGSRHGAELLARWVHGATQDSDSLRRITCANALAQVGWPAALTWLGQEWSLGNDGYFEAICIGAAHGHLSPALLDSEGTLRMLQQGGLKVNGAGARAPEPLLLAARALRVFPDVLSDGGSLGDVLLQDWPKDDPRAQWLRYSAFSGRFRAHPGISVQALECVNSQAAPALRRAALAALVSAGGKNVGELKQVASMLSGLDANGVEAWVRDLELLGVCPGSDADFQALREHESFAGRFAFWWFLVGKRAEAAAVVTGLVGTEGSLQSLVFSLEKPLARGRRAEVLSWVESLRQMHPEHGRRLALRLSLTDPAGAFRQLEQILGQSEPDAESLMDLAYLAPMNVVGARARSALIGALAVRPVPAGLGAALEQTQFNLRSSGAFLQAELFEADLRRKAIPASHPLTDRLLNDAWARRPHGNRAPARALLGSQEALAPH
ncbi:MAG: hypothetical protein GY930_12155 [bacterium]|nr:hypothetical protein [bacterium]